MCNAISLRLVSISAESKSIFDTSFGNEMPFFPNFVACVRLRLLERSSIDSASPELMITFFLNLLFDNDAETIFWKIFNYDIDSKQKTALGMRSELGRFLQ